MTDRKLTCAACKSAITKGDIAGSDLEFGGELKATNQPTYTADADTDLVATVGTLDEYTPMVRTTGNQPNIAGIKGFISGISAYPNDWHDTKASTGSAGDIKLFAKLKNNGAGKFLLLEFIELSNTAVCYGILGIHNIVAPANNSIGWLVRKGIGANNPLTMDSILIATKDNEIYLASRKTVTYGNLQVRVKVANNYDVIDTNPTSQIEWLDSTINVGDGTGYTIVEAVE